MLRSLPYLAAILVGVLILLASARSEGAPGRLVPDTITPGASTNVVMAIAGVPDAIDCGLDEMTWRYGESSGLRVTIHHDVVIGVAGELPADRARIDLDPKMPHLGAGAAPVAALLGSPTSTLISAAGSQHHYPSGWVIGYRFGRVVYAERR